MSLARPDPGVGSEEPDIPSAAAVVEEASLGIALKEELIRAATRFIGLDLALVMRVEGGGGLVVRSCSDEDLVGARIAAASPIVAAVLDGDAIIGADPARALADALGGLPAWARDGHAIIAPVTWQRRVVGAFAGVDRDPGALLDEVRIGLVTTFARVVALEIALSGERMAAENARTRMAGLVDAGMALAGELDLEELLQRLVESARQVLGARYAALGVLDRDGAQLERFITSGLSAEQRAAIGALPLGRGILGALIRDPRPLRLERMADDPRSAGFPSGHPPMESFLGVPITLRGEVFGNLYVTEKVSASFSAEDEQLAQVLAAQAAVAIDNARRYESQAARLRDLQRIQDVTATAAEVGRSLLGTVDLQQLLSLVARRLRRLLDADTTAVAVLEGDALAVRHAHGVHALALEQLTGVRDETTLETAARMVLPELGVHVLPLVDGGERLGALVAVGLAEFDDMARALMSGLGGQTVIALRMAQRHRERMDALRASAVDQAAEARARADVEVQRRALEAQERERARIARELHDETGQLLTAMGIHLGALASRIRDEAALEQLAGLRSMLRDASDNVRRLLNDLRPGSIREQGLAPAIEEICRRLEDHHGIACAFDAAQLPEDLPDEVQIALYRVVQESLTNVVRHAAATSASVLIAVRGTRLRLVVEDDGRGFDPAAPTARLGLAGVRERVELMRGVLRVESAPGEGAAVIVDLDLAAG